MISTSGTKEAYESWHNHLDVDYLAGTPWHKLVKKHLTSADVTGKSVLEIGCGRGGFACWLARHNSSPEHIVAADFSYTAVRKGQSYASQLGLTRIAWEVMDVEAIAHRDESFD